MFRSKNPQTFCACTRPWAPWWPWGSPQTRLEVAVGRCPTGSGACTLCTVQHRARGAELGAGGPGPLWSPGCAGPQTRTACAEGPRQGRGAGCPQPLLPLGLRRQEEAGLSLSQTLVKRGRGGGVGGGSWSLSWSCPGDREAPQGPKPCDSQGSRWSERGQHGGAGQGLQKRGGTEREHGQDRWGPHTERVCCPHSREEKQGLARVSTQRLLPKLGALCSPRGGEGLSRAAVLGWG